MNYGLYLAASGALAHMNRQDVLTNNLANVDTVGFKPDRIFLRQRLPQRLEAGAAVDPQRLLERLGGAVTLDPMRFAFEQGALRQTGRPLDVAIRGAGFFVVRGDQGGLHLTRDGRFELDDEGRLVMAATGMRVLGVDGEPIRLRRGADVEITADGDLRQDGTVVGTIRVAAARNPDALVKSGDSLLKSADGAAPDGGPAAGRLRQGHVERSAVDAVKTLNELMSAAKAAQGNLKMMQYHDHVIGQVINTFGRVA